MNGPEEPTDEELVARCQQELPYQTRSFAILVERHQPRVLRTALRYLGSEADAQDASQEVFIRVFRALPRFEARAAFTTWLYRIVMNVCATRHQRRKRRREKNKRWQTQSGVADRHDPRGDILDRLDANDDVARALETLSTSDREILLLRFVSDLPLEAIGETLGIGGSATKMRLSRAKERLAKALVATKDADA